MQGIIVSSGNAYTSLVHELLYLSILENVQGNVDMTVKFMFTFIWYTNA